MSAVFIPSKGLGFTEAGINYRLDGELVEAISIISKYSLRFRWYKPVCHYGRVEVKLPFWKFDTDYYWIIEITSKEKHINNKNAWALIRSSRRKKNIKILNLALDPLSVIGELGLGSMIKLELLTKFNNLVFKHERSI